MSDIHNHTAPDQHLYAWTWDRTCHPAHFYVFITKITSSITLGSPIIPKTEPISLLQSQSQVFRSSVATAPFVGVSIGTLLLWELCLAEVPLAHRGLQSPSWHWSLRTLLERFCYLTRVFQYRCPKVFTCLVA